MRASDADRERVAERLRQAATEGRLETEELEQRLETALSARTYGQLDTLVADLPGPRPVVRREARALAWVPPAVAAVIAVPLALAVIVAVIFAVTGVLAGWVLWVAAAWWFFGRRRRRIYGGRYGRSLNACGGWHQTRRPAAHPSRAYWA